MTDICLQKVIEIVIVWVWTCINGTDFNLDMCNMAIQVETPGCRQQKITNRSVAQIYDY